MSEITTKTKHKKKPHERFTQVTQFDSSPTQLVIESESTNREIKDLSPNPLKYSFGKVRFPHGMAEACIYLDPKRPQEMPNSVLWFYQKDHFAKGEGFVSDIRRTKEFRSLITKVLYFQSLSPKRKLEYLQNRGVFANINIRKVGKNEVEN